LGIHGNAQQSALAIGADPARNVQRWTSKEASSLDDPKRPGLRRHEQTSVGSEGEVRRHRYGGDQFIDEARR
jgi:hypothetical protein